MSLKSRLNYGKNRDKISASVESKAKMPLGGILIVGTVSGGDAV